MLPDKRVSSVKFAQGEFLVVLCIVYSRTYPNVPLTVLQRKGTDGAEVHDANPKSHNYKFTHISNTIKRLKLEL